MLEDKELYRGTSRKVNGKWGIREAIDIFISRLYYEVAVSSWEGCNPSSLQ